MSIFRYIIIPIFNATSGIRYDGPYGWDTRRASHFSLLLLSRLRKNLDLVATALLSCHELSCDMSNEPAFMWSAFATYREYYLGEDNS